MHWQCSRLTTPHGDRKLAGGRIEKVLNLVSLPLMGIGNAWLATPVAGAFDCSLPLMGIGNPLLHNRVHGGHATSLPLMGIGNLPAVEVGVALPFASDVSLPLMGIGNKTGDFAASTVWLHSLPLMGIGNVARAVRRPSASSSHYPSWGSETFHGETGETSA